MENLTLLRRDAYLENLKPGVKHDTLSALCNCPLNGYALFPDAVIRKAEDEITKYENSKRTSQPGPGQGGFSGGYKKQQQHNCFQPYLSTWKQSQDSSRVSGKTGKDMPAWKSFGGRGRSRGRFRGGQSGRGTRPPKEAAHYKDNYCITEPVPVTRSVAFVKSVTEQAFSVTVQPHVWFPVVSPVHFVQKVQRPTQKNDISPLSKAKREINKYCERCFYCRSLYFCPKCSQCPQCCTCPAGGRSSPKLLAYMVPPRRKSEGCVHIERRLHSSVQTQTSTGERPIDNQWVCKPPQEPLPEGGFACIDPQKGSREDKGSNLSSLLQQVIHCPQTKPEIAANIRPQCS